MWKVRSVLVPIVWLGMSMSGDVSSDVLMNWSNVLARFVTGTISR